MSGVIDQIRFAQTATLEELKVFLMMTFLNYEAQVALVHRKDNALLREYVNKFKMCNKAQLALVATRNKEILSLHNSKYGLCAEATEGLINLL